MSGVEFRIHGPERPPDRPPFFDGPHPMHHYPPHPHHFGPIPPPMHPFHRPPPFPGPPPHLHHLQHQAPPPAMIRSHPPFEIPLPFQHFHPPLHSFQPHSPNPPPPLHRNVSRANPPLLHNPFLPSPRPPFSPKPRIQHNSFVLQHSVNQFSPPPLLLPPTTITASSKPQEQRGATQKQRSVKANWDVAEPPSPESDWDQADSSEGRRRLVISLLESTDFSYRPMPPNDPFQHSKSLRHQQPANLRRKRDEDNDGEEPDSGDDDTDLEDETDEDFILREEKAYQELVPKVKHMMLELGVNENWAADREEKNCIVCPFPQRLKGWTALLQHTEKFKKRRAAQHRAYHRALAEHLKRGPRKDDDDSFQERAVLIDSGRIAEEIIVWPPLVIIMNIRENESLDHFVPNAATLDIEKTLRERVRGQSGRMLVVFPATEVGHLNAKLLVDSLVKLASSNITPGWGSTGAMVPIADCGCRQWPNGDGRGFQQLYIHRQLPTGQLAEPADMMKIDPHKKLINWSQENKREILKSVSKKSKEEHEREKAKVKAKLVEVDRIAESHQKFKFSKAQLSQQLKDAEMGLQLQKTRARQIAANHAEQLQIMDTRFKDDLRRLEIEQVTREKKIRLQLEANEKQLEKERIERTKEVDILKRHFENITQELEIDKAQKALEKEREIARKREEFFAEIKQREAQFIEDAHVRERSMLEKHESEKRMLVEDFDKMRQDILMEWVDKQAALKGKAEKAKQEKEWLEKEARSNPHVKENSQESAECSVCFDKLGDETKRALIQPCGHAKICVKCAVDIFSSTRLCPICRVKMSTKPKAMPAKLYM